MRRSGLGAGKTGYRAVSLLLAAFMVLGTACGGSAKGNASAAGMPESGTAAEAPQTGSSEHVEPGALLSGRYESARAEAPQNGNPESAASEAVPAEELIEESGAVGAEGGGIEGSRVGEAGSENSRAGEPDAPEIPGLTWQGTMELRHADQFRIDRYEGGNELITVADGRHYLLLSGAAAETEFPADALPDGTVVLKKPVRNIYLANSAAMALFFAAGAEESVRFTGLDTDGWSYEKPKEALRSGQMLFAGKYSAPDFELLTAEDCSLAVENTMILHTPKVIELLDEVGIPVFIDRSSYESDPLGRTEWVRLYGVLTGHEEEAERFFAEQEAKVKALPDLSGTGKKAACFFINAAGIPSVRSSSDYVAKLITMAGGTYAFQDLGTDSTRSNVQITMEDLYENAADADVLIYNETVEGELTGLDALKDKSGLLPEFKAVRLGQVYATGSDLFQSPDLIAELLVDIHEILSAKRPEDTDGKLRLLRRLK